MQLEKNLHIRNTSNTQASQAKKPALQPYFSEESMLMCEEAAKPLMKRKMLSPHKHCIFRGQFGSEQKILKCFLLR